MPKIWLLIKRLYFTLFLFFAQKLGGSVVPQILQFDVTIMTAATATGRTIMLVIVTDCF